MPSHGELKTCQICCSEVSSFKRTPNTCSSQHERACSECWEAHLSLQVEEKDPREIPCLFCESIIDRAELSRLAHKATLLRFDLKLEDATHRFCQDRCPKRQQHGVQAHDRERDGRVFACEFCDFQTCIDCDRPEHSDESCSEYQARVVQHPKHVRDERARREVFLCCPGCDISITKEKCGFLQCTACGHRFCSHCGIAWVGENSAYLGGKQAHAEGCLYRTRDRTSVHALKRRFEDDDETKGRLEHVKRAKDLGKRMKLEMEAGWWS